MRHMMKLLAVAAVLLLTIIGAMAEVKLETVFQYRTVIQPVPGTGYLIVESKQDNTRGLYKTDGKEVIPCATKSLDYISNGFFCAYDDKDALADKTLWNADGQRLGTGYGAFKVFNDHWVAAFVINPQEVSDSEKDISIGGKAYQYARIDLFYVTDKSGESIEPVAALDRNGYMEAAIHGKYIAITDRQKAVSVYDSSFQQITAKLNVTNKSLYAAEKYQIIDLLNKKNLGDGYTEVAEINLGDRMLIKATRIAFDGTKLAALLNPNGSVLLPADYEIIDLIDHYAVVADLDKQQGLFSLDEERFIVPCAYTAIVACNTDMDKYVHNGYVCVEKDGKVGFYDMANGVESCEPVYSKRAVTIIGCSLIYHSLEGDLTLVAADGEVSTLNADDVLVTRGDGYLLEVKKGGSFGLIDWHGNTILPMNHFKDIIVTDDSRAIIRTSTGLQLDTVTR